LLARNCYEIDQARSDIRQAFLSDDEFVLWQSCSAIVQWGRLTSQGRLQWVTGLESLLGSAVLYQCDERLVLPLTAARELLEVFPTFDESAFMDDLVCGLTSLAAKLNYTSRSTLSIEKKIRIRIACVRLVRQLISLGQKGEILSQWMESARNDCFAEVRRAADN